MKRVSLFVIAVILTSVIHAQIEKKTWMIGGNGSFRKWKSTGSFGGTGSVMNVNVNVGHFFIDKLVAGARLNYGMARNNTAGTPTTSQSTYGGGPFARYYFFPDNQPFNLVVDADIRWKTSNLNGKRVKGSTTEYSFNAGPVLFFNPSVGLELLVGYSHWSNSSNKITESSINVSIGLHAYLVK